MQGLKNDCKKEIGRSRNPISRAKTCNRTFKARIYQGEDAFEGEKMITDTGLIVMSIISLAGMVLLFTLNNSTWFKRERFKISKKNLMDENRIKLKKLERDLGIKAGSTPRYQEPKSTMDLAGDLLPVLKNLSGDQIQGLADKFIGSSEEPAYDAPEGDLTSTLLDYATKNPEMVKGLLDGFTKKKGGGDEFSPQV